MGGGGEELNQGNTKKYVKRGKGRCHATGKKIMGTPVKDAFKAM